MKKILLDYVFPISVITPTPQASTAFLRQVCLVCKPKAGEEANVGNIYECVSATEVAVRTDNVEATQLFNAGMSKVYILLADALDLTDPIEANPGLFYTVLISSDFVDADVTATKAALTKKSLTFTALSEGQAGNDISVEFLNTGTAGAEVVTVTTKKISVSMEDGVSTATQMKAAIDASAAAMLLIAPVTIASGQDATTQDAFAEANLAGGDGFFRGGFKGVVGYSSTSQVFAKAFAAVAKQCAFFTKSGNGAKNMCYAFGALLSNLVAFRDQQYIEMPFADDVDELGEANSLFDDKVSFVISDSEFGNRLGLFCAGAKAIAAPYILKNLCIDLQSRAVQWITANQPKYTKKEAALLETRLQQDVVDEYISDGEIESGSVEITLAQQNFVAAGEINVPTPTALWRVVSEMTEA